MPPLFTEPGWNMHTPEEIGIDDFQAERSPDERYRTAPLKGLVDAHRRAASITTAASRRCATWSTTTTAFFGLGLTRGEKADLVEYLKSL